MKNSSKKLQKYVAYIEAVTEITLTWLLFLDHSGKT